MDNPGSEIGFLALYDGIDRIELGRGYWADVKRYLSGPEMAAAQRALVDPRHETKVAAPAKAKAGAGDPGADDGFQTVTSTIDQSAYHHELLVAAIVGWNLTDKHNQPLPLPPDNPRDPGNPRRRSIRLLPNVVIQKIVAKIVENQAKDEGADPQTFPDAGDSDAVPAG